LVSSLEKLAERDMNKSDFVTDVEAIRERARKDMNQGPVTENYTANKEAVVKVLNSALATEIVCVLRYRRHHFMAKGINHEPVASEFLEHAQEEQEHADRIAVRITQLGGEPDLNPANLVSRSHSQYVEGKDLIDMVKEDLIAERIAVDTYREIIRYLGDDDPTTRRLLEDILEKEEEHADEMANLLSHYDVGQNGTRRN
jgi:bacterioferritin